MKKLLSTLTILFTLITFTQAQTNGTIAGRVMDAQNGEVLAGMSVTIPGSNIVKLTDVEGRYNFSLAPGTYILQFEYLGYQPKKVSEVVVKAGAVNELNIVMDRANDELAAVVVTASARKETVASVLTLQRNNAAISDGISIESIKKSPDRNVGEVLKRVSGTSIQDDKFVVVRGLSDRYNIAMLNGTMLPSTEPDRRAFSFDIVPSSLIDNILINKTASADLPGDFSGGVVQVLTKDIPFKNFFGLSLSTGYNTVSTGKDFQINQLPGRDYLGFDDGTRAFPSNFPKTSEYRNASLNQRTAYSQMMKNNYGDRYSGKALPPLSFQANGGTRHLLKNGGKMGTVYALTYRNAQNIQNNIRRDYQTDNEISLDRGNIAFNYNDTLYNFSTNLGAMANVAYSKGQSKIAFKNLFNRSFDVSNQIREGINVDNNQYVRGNAYLTTAKTMVNSQLEGEHRISEKNNRVKWNINYTNINRDQPDYRILPYSKVLGTENDKSVPFNLVDRDTYRFWSELMEHNAGAQVNYSHPVELFGENGTLKSGVFALYKSRDFSTRIFRYQQASADFDRSLLALSPEEILSLENMKRTGFVLNDVTNLTDRYTASSQNYAAYGLYDGKISEKMRAVLGLRVENFQFIVNTNDLSGAPTKVDKNYLDVLPSLNLTYNLAERTSLRFSASRTVSRPEFREAANFAFYDYQRNAQVVGNTEIERAQVTNIDLRFEKYPTPTENISASIFFKHFDNPIEQIVTPGSFPSNLTLSFVNQEAAVTYGAEVDLRKNLLFLGGAPWLEQLNFSMNAAYIFSEITLDKTTNVSYDENRPMQGQSPYLLNFGLNYSSVSNKYSVGALFNRIGPRIHYVGFQGYPDIYENARSVVDLQASMKILNEKGELKFSVSDLLNQRSILYQNVDVEDHKGYSSSTDRIQYSYLYGTNISLGFSLNL